MPVQPPDVSCDLLPEFLKVLSAHRDEVVTVAVAPGSVLFAAYVSAVVDKVEPYAPERDPVARPPVAEVEVEVRDGRVDIRLSVIVHAVRVLSVQSAR
jgi:hypothetical protein